MDNILNFCPITTFKVESLLRMHRKHVIHGTRSAGLKKSLSMLSCPSVGHSNCWLPTLNLAVAHWLLHIVGKVRSCFTIVKNSSMWICAHLHALHLQASTAGDPGVHKVIPKAQNER